MGALNTICSVLDVNDVKITLVCLEGLEAILRKSCKEEYLLLFEEQGGINKLEDLQENEDEEVYKKAVSIIETYFNDDDSEDDEDDEDDENQDPVFTSSTSGKAGAFAGFGENNTNNNVNDIFGTTNDAFGNAGNAMDWGF